MKTSARLATLLTAACSLSVLAGCVTTQAQADGSTRVNVSVAQALGMGKQDAAPAASDRPAIDPVASKAPAALAAPKKELSSLTRKRLEEALMCKQLTPFPGKTKKLRDKAEEDFYPALQASGYSVDNNMFDIPHAPLMVFGLPVTKTMIAAESFEVIYRSYHPGATREMLIKAANLKLGKDKLTWGAQRKGTLTLEQHDNVWTLSCLTYSH